jgi:hypothetical protein
MAEKAASAVPTCRTSSNTVQLWVLADVDDRLDWLLVVSGPFWQETYGAVAAAGRAGSAMVATTARMAKSFIFCSKCFAHDMPPAPDCANLVGANDKRLSRTRLKPL